MDKCLTYYQENPEALLDSLIDLIGEESLLRGIALRGLYKGEMKKKKLKCSRVWEDGEPTNKKLSGTSALLVSGDWDYDSRKIILQNLKYSLLNIAQYGDSDYVAVIKGTPRHDDPAEDVNEIILGDAEIVVCIHR